MKRKVKTLKALIICSTNKDYYTLCLKEGLGGPIVGDNDLERAKEKFIEAFQLATAVQKLSSYKEDLSVETFETDYNIEYEEIAYLDLKKIENKINEKEN